MAKYGKFINGELRTIDLEPYNERYEDEDGEIQERTITVEQQAERAQEQGFKPVDDIDEDRLKEAAKGTVVVFEPVDLGDRIGYEYKTVKDKQYFIREIDKYKKLLSDSDYQVTKCLEASMAGETLPYDFQELRSKRQQAREKINILEEQLSE